MIGERPEPHLLRAVDWFDSQGIRRDVDKVYNFKHTLDGEAREWYADYARQTDVIPPWKTLINDFSRYYSLQGRGEKNLHEAGEICPSHQPPTMSKYNSEICESAQNN